MLDLVFLVLLIVVVYNAFHGEFKETLCNVATVVGIVAAIIGLITAFLKHFSSDTAPLFLNLFVLIFAVLLRKIAQQFVKLYEEKERAEAEKQLALLTRYSRETDKALSPVYTEENFDDPELRFGKGGYTDNDL